MKLREFNEQGIEAFRAHLNRIREDKKGELPPELLNDPALTNLLKPDIEIEPQLFSSRFDFAEWFFGVLSEMGADPHTLSKGLWCWLSAALFDQVCPVNGKGQRKVGAEPRYIPDLARYTRRYRHLLRTPFLIYHLHSDDPERAMVVLVNPLDKPGELTEQIASRAGIVRCPGMMRMATGLFIDPETRQRKKGASGDAAARFGVLMNQYQLTWDLPSVDIREFTQLLPREFNRFKSKP
tara:strand:+ start:64504 stop:65217 length:714 start_codon:yes stop_codon:yes gene_type:complete